MNEQATKSYGLVSQPLTLLPAQKVFLDHLWHRGEDDIYKQDKKLNVFYRIVYKYKNNDRAWSEKNNEVMLLEIDTNRSPDFTCSHVDMSNHTSMTISINEIEQPRWGKTAIRLIESYVNETQELIEHSNTLYVDTLSGTLAKRMEHYRKAFYEFSEQRIAQYQVEGIEERNDILMSNMADYLTILSGRDYYDLRVRINQVLTIYSALNNDCFHQKWFELDFYQYPFSFNRREQGYRPKTVFLFEYQSNLLEKINRFYGAHEKQIYQHVEECRKLTSSNHKERYVPYRDGLLKLWKEWEEN